MGSRREEELPVPRAIPKSNVRNLTNATLTQAIAEAEALVVGRDHGTVLPHVTLATVAGEAVSRGDVSLDSAR